MMNMAKSIRHLFKIQLKQMKERRRKIRMIITLGQPQQRLDILQHIRRLAWKMLLAHQLRTLWKVIQIRSNHNLTETGLRKDIKNPWLTLWILGGERMTTGSGARVTRGRMDITKAMSLGLTSGATTMKNAVKTLIEFVKDSGMKTKILASVLA
jgi:hypothetical protein